VDADLETIVMKCLEKEPDRRYPTALALAEDITRFIAGEPIGARPRSWIYRARRELWRRRTAATVVVVVLAAAAILAVAGLRRSDEARRRAIDDARAARARPFLDSGRTRVADLGRLLSDPRRTPEQVDALAQAARRDLDRAIAEDAGLAEAHLERARMLRLVGDVEEAIAACARAIELAPSHGTAYLERAILNLERYDDLRHGGSRRKSDRRREAELRAAVEADMTRVREWSREREEHLLTDGLLAFAAGEFERAARLLRDYTTRNASDARAWRWLGHAWHHVPGHDAEAEEALRRAGHDAESLDLLATLLDRMGRTEEALAICADLVRMNPRSADVHVSRAWILTQRPREALAAYEEAIRLDPKLAGALASNMAGLLAAAADLPKALERIDVGVPDDPENPRVFAVRGLILFRLDRAEESPDLDPDDGYPYSIRAELLFRREERARALPDAETAIRLGHANLACHVIVAHDRAARGDLQGAVLACGEAIASEPGKAWTYALRAQFHAARGDRARALADYDRALQLDPALLDALVNRGNLRKKGGEYRGALADFDRALEIDPNQLATYVNRAGVRLEPGDARVRWRIVGGPAARAGQCDGVLQSRRRLPRSWQWRQGIGRLQRSHPPRPGHGHRARCARRPVRGRRRDGRGAGRLRSGDRPRSLLPLRRRQSGQPAQAPRQPGGGARGHGAGDRHRPGDAGALRQSRLDARVDRRETPRRRSA
jgi:tetratricopeptide (TPR) repeat protein